jgi:hypothetical protein
LGEGKNVKSIICAKDLAAAFVLLVEEALKNGGGIANWWEKGWYYVKGGEYVLAEIVELIVKEMSKRGVIKNIGGKR